MTTFETGIARYEWDGNILISHSKSVLRTVDLMNENASAVKHHTSGKPVKLLIYLADSPMPDKATRVRSNELVPELYSAMAMITKPGLGQLILKMVFGLKTPPIPMKFFSTEADAKRWLDTLKIDAE